MRSSLNASLLVNLLSSFFFLPAHQSIPFLFFSFFSCIIDFIPRDLNGLDFYVFLSSNLRIRNFFEKRNSIDIFSRYLRILEQLVKLFSQQHVDSCIMIVHRSIIDRAKLLESHLYYYPPYLNNKSEQSKGIYAAIFNKTRTRK